jgi:hypothetical protein
LVIINGTEHGTPEQWVTDDWANPTAMDMALDIYVKHHDGHSVPEPLMKRLRAAFPVGNNYNGYRMKPERPNGLMVKDAEGHRLSANGAWYLGDFPKERMDAGWAKLVQHPDLLRELLGYVHVSYLEP